MRRVDSRAMMDIGDMQRDEQELNRLLHANQGGETVVLAEKLPRVAELADRWREVDGLATINPGLHGLVQMADEPA